MENSKLLKVIEARNKSAAKARGKNFMQEAQCRTWSQDSKITTRAEGRRSTAEPTQVSQKDYFLKLDFSKYTLFGIFNFGIT